MRYMYREIFFLNLRNSYNQRSLMLLSSHIDLNNSHLNESKTLIWKFTERYFRKVGSHSVTQRPKPLVMG